MTVFRQRNTARARELRNNMTPAECGPWLHLQNRKLGGHKFSRQMDVDAAHPDFICRSHHLIIELDGESHDFTVEADLARTRRLERSGYRVIRFTNQDVFEHLDGVLAVISQALADQPHPARSASCPSRGREGS